MNKEQLDQLHPEQDLALFGDYDALYRGGKALQARLKRLLPTRPEEDAAVYTFRLQSYHFLPYAGPIVDYLVSWLFTGRMEIRTRGDEGAEPPPPPEWWGEFKEDCDGNGTDLMALLRQATLDMLVGGRVWLQLDFPVPAATPNSKADWKQQGLDMPYVCVLQAPAVLDWHYGEDGELAWAITKSTCKERSAPGATRDTVTERWTVWERDGWTRYRLDTKDGESHDPQKPIPIEAQGPSPTPGRVPLVEMVVPEGLWLMNRLYSPALEQFRARNALSWSLNRTCYAMRVFHVKAAVAEDELPTHGPGLGMTLGVDEKVSWDAPPMDAFQPFEAYTQALKDELYRIANQMAMGVDNNAAAIGRSGESKAVDAASGEVLLRVYGMLVCEACERLLSLAAVGRGEEPNVHCSGMDSFSEGDVTGLVDNVTKVDALAIPSRTLHVRMYQRLARAVVRDASQDDHDTIAKEIETNVTNEELAARAAVRLAPPTPPGAEEGDGEEPPDDEDLPPAKPAKKPAAKPAKKAARK